ncbi:MAG: bacillithiol biosynthesis BshC [Bacteroidia bacterium]|nr:bacillithiol biosynthesis cysteine-adding enzyme BshC [Bacteroidia bacterium]MDW8159352.1 bacillithiol biosynthesis BshC [Bacteroidia bacterium]
MYPQRSIEEDYLAGVTELVPFYRWLLRQDTIPEIIEERKKYYIDRPTLVQVFTEQYQAWGINSQTIQESINSILEPQTFFITTGQQPCLFGGPLFVIYKALTAIVLARSLQKQYPHFRFVPLFWMATEDHDYAEVNHCYFEFGKKTFYAGKFSGAVGRHILDNQIKDITPPYLDQFYFPSQKWSTAFAQLLHHWLGSWGLLILDPDSQNLKKLFAPKMLLEATHRLGFSTVNETSKALAELGYKVQAKAQPINLFYLTNRLRERIEWDNYRQEYTVRNTGYSFTVTELEEAILQRPYFFSPNVILRPIYQESILPSIIYVGGWAEIAYWLQLKKLFGQYRTFFPLLYPRFSALLITSEQQVELNRYCITLEQLLQPDKVLFTQIAEQLWQRSILDETNLKIEIALHELANYLETLAPGQAYNARALIEKNKKYLSCLRHRVNKQVINKNPGMWYPIYRLKNKIEPEGTIQERTLNLLAFGTMDIISNIIQQIASHIEAWVFNKKIIFLE